ncbi:helix-turn-helix domain-containing protein [Vibrio astriarenae]
MKDTDIHLVSRESVILFASMLKEVDSDIYGLLRQATIPNDIDTETDYRFLPESSLKNTLDLLAAKLSNQTLGWLFLRTCKEKYIPRFVNKLSRCSTVKEALERFCQQLNQESTGAKTSLQHAGETWWFVREKNGVDEAWFKYAEMFSVIFMCELIRALINDKWRPERVGIQSPCIDEFTKLPSMELAQFFLERPMTAVEINEATLALPVRVSRLKGVLDNARIAQQLDSLSFTQQFTLAITPYLSMGKLPIKIAAEILRMNVRTLQRKLAAENIIYKQLIEDLVFKEVSKRIIETDDAITQIAIRYGYSDGAHFTRSFKRIYGVSPLQYRKQNRDK